MKTTFFLALYGTYLAGRGLAHPARYEVGAHHRHDLRGRSFLKEQPSQLDGHTTSSLPEVEMLASF